MIYTFYTIPSYKKFEGEFNNLINGKNRILNSEIYKITHKCKNITVGKRNLYLYNSDDYFVNVIELKGKFFKPNTYVTKKYYNEHIDIYKRLKKIGLCEVDGYKNYEIYKIDYYIFNNFIGRDLLNYTNLIKEEVIKKGTFEMENIHEPIDFTKLNFINNDTLKGTLIDICIKYAINNKQVDPLEYFKSCKSFENIPENIKLCNSSEELIKELFFDDFNSKIQNLKDKFTNLNTTDYFVNFDLKTYGEADLISEDYVIDIKFSKNKEHFCNPKNYLQSMYYAISLNKKNFAIYVPQEGTIYKTHMTDDYIIKFKNYILSAETKFEKKSKKETIVKKIDVNDLQEILGKNVDINDEILNLLT